MEAVCEVVGEQRYTADGQGRSYDPEGHLTYDGSWRNGYRNGHGIEFFADGRERYSGEYVNGLKQGSGRLHVLENGNYYLLYQGTLDYECFNGPGTMYSADGQVWFSGCWYYGEPLM